MSCGRFTSRRSPSKIRRETTQPVTMLLVTGRPRTGISKSLVAAGSTPPEACAMLVAKRAISAIEEARPIMGSEACAEERCGKTTSGQSRRNYRKKPEQVRNSLFAPLASN
jgi:hypothetical protein